VSVLLGQPSAEVSLPLLNEIHKVPLHGLLNMPSQGIEQAFLKVLPRRAVVMLNGWINLDQGTNLVASYLAFGLQSASFDSSPDGLLRHVEQSCSGSNGKPQLLLGLRGGLLSVILGHMPTLAAMLSKG
jgi:hypothetical protein